MGEDEESTEVLPCCVVCNFLSNFVYYLPWNIQPSGHRWTFMKAPVIGFQILLFMHLEGTSPGAEHIPCLILCSTFFDSRSWGFAVYRLVEKIVLLLNSGAGSGRYFAVTSNAQDYFGFLHNGSR
ncbi:hypothetical protein NC653_025379 [Populus alba x Populus x berolinensis]|uniref:Uncharacterized protein n=1 Tax=Populus alba x Populus x berolinensis TaxID=444605 RepID=A0AAD6MB51_9ROSI|nr:hypothetical protein NC653_025379 [Populus alba x Populus x berolinensis]